jgi:uncharacterized protein (DUF2132 family)
MSTGPAQPRNPLHGLTLEAQLNQLVQAYGWPGLGERIALRCFTHEPSVASSLKFLRRTPWARAKVDAVLAPHLAAVESQSLDALTKRAVVRLGEAYSIATPYTSFVAVEKSRVVVGGKPMLVSVPVELPSGTNWNGFFGEGAGVADVMAAEARGARRPAGAVESFGLDLSRIAAEGQPSGRVDESRRELAALEPRQPGRAAAARARARVRRGL